MMKHHRGGKQKGFGLGKYRLVGPVEKVTTEHLPARLAAMGWKETKVPRQGKARVYKNTANPGAHVWIATTTGQAGILWEHYQDNGHRQDIVQYGKKRTGTATGLVHYLAGLRALDEIATLERVWALPARGPA